MTAAWGPLAGLIGDWVSDYDGYDAITISAVDTDGVKAGIKALLEAGE